MKQSRRVARETGRCDIPRCRREAEQVFIGKGVCGPHWDRYMGDQYPDSSELRRRLGIKEGA